MLYASALGLLIGLCVVGYAVWTARRADATRNWDSVQGTLRSFEITEIRGRLGSRGYTVAVDYGYEVEGKDAPSKAKAASEGDSATQAAVRAEDARHRAELGAGKQAYRSRRLAYGGTMWGSLDEVELWLAENVKDDRVEVFYDPKRPASSVLLPGRAGAEGNAIVLITGLVIAAMSGFVLAYELRLF
ncbi:MAG: DUF3592 domain-containing protein [Sandaracinaceae bacterium]|nr:DUF3592 domain-containing protein [Sandaracinaceae bacterium]